MRNALADAGLAPEDIDYINAHGTSTPENDKMECQCVITVFGDHAKKIPISSTKSMIGHTLSAAGAIEAVVTLMTRDHQLVRLRRAERLARAGPGACLMADQTSRRALVTGGGRGLGSAIVRTLAAAGQDVVFIYRSASAEAD